MESAPLLAAALGVALLVSYIWQRPKHLIPALAGSENPISYYIGAFQFFLHGLDIVQHGYTEHREGVFRVPRLLRWDYLANGPKHTAEMAAASDDVLSFQYGAEDILQADYTMGLEVTKNPYHQHTIRSSLTRNIARFLPQLHDELVCAFDDVIALPGNDWEEINVLPNMMQVVARLTARIFVGLPLCRNQEYLNLSISYTVSVFGRAQIIAMFPSFLKPIFGRLLSSRRSSMRVAMKTIGPVIQERLAKVDEFGPNWEDKPNDLISWLVDDAQGEERTAPAIALRILATNTAAIHTSSMTITTALYDLTTYPEHIVPMREEAERVIRAQGWTKSAVNNLRVHGSGPFSMTRKVVAENGFTFSNGTFIPHGILPEPYYENPEVFDGFRFAREREMRTVKDGTEGGAFKHHMISTGPDHLVFGHGKHACPGLRVCGRLTLSLAIIIGPDPKGKILIRKRRGVRRGYRSFCVC
ncbi:cytochrome P450 [Mycena alexandri]|uniref:Cytochrome P450 n=1 Tax=Mycena alexandri TaxID=1745969 RepID=A0AAD6WLT2_9AGAR|nr:cytochrome P450 [Mycena alexandri]